MSAASSPEDWKKLRPADDVFDVAPDVWYQLCYTAFKGYTSLLLGPAGCGKTEVCGLVARAFGKNLEVFNCGAMTEPCNTLIGNTHFDSVKGTWFAESRFVRSIRTEGAQILLDELTRGGRDAFNILFPVLDSQGSLPIDEKEDGAVVRRAARVTFFATANLGAEYTSADQVIDKGLKDRFTSIICMDYPPIAKEVELLKKRCPCLNPETAQRFVQLANKQRQLAKEGEFSETISTRMLLAAGRQVADGIPLKEAVTFCISNQFNESGGDASERARLYQICQAQQLFKAQAPARAS